MKEIEHGNEIVTVNSNARINLLNLNKWNLPVKRWWLSLGQAWVAVPGPLLLAGGGNLRWLRGHGSDGGGHPCDAPVRFLVKLSHKTETTELARDTGPHGTSPRVGISVCTGLRAVNVALEDTRGTDEVRCALETASAASSCHKALLWLCAWGTLSASRTSAKRPGQSRLGPGWIQRLQGVRTLKTTAPEWRASWRCCLCQLVTDKIMTVGVSKIPRWSTWKPYASKRLGWLQEDRRKL